MKKLLLAAAVLIVLVGGALTALNLAFDETKVETHTISEPVRAIVVKSDSGDVDLVPGDTPIEVRETQHYVFEQPTLERDVRDGVLTLDSRCGGNVVRCYSDLRVTVPAGVDVTVEADSGDVEARAIDVRSARATSDSGDVRLELAGSQRLAWAHTDSGDVDVVAVDAREIDAQTDSGDVAVQAGASARRVAARTDSGDVRVTVPPGDYAVDARTDSGDTDIDGIARDDRAPRSIAAQTDSGDVTLRGAANQPR
ncbi:MAG: DUF4097 family beta strand repeat-containing protein [Solirubrobacteraceae bacterium]